MSDSSPRGLAHTTVSTVNARQREILGAAPSLTFGEMTAKAGVSPATGQAFWRTLGLPLPAPDAVAFTYSDVEALIQMVEVSGFGVMSERTANSVMRAMAHTGERLAWWQLEALVDDVGRRYDLDDVSARLVVLDHISDVADIFEEQLVYAWRRHLAAILERFGSDVSTARATDKAGPASLPLLRAVGFADLVQFTQLSAGMGPQALADLVQRFEWTVRDVVAAQGGRVIKTIGDEVMFVADDPARGAQIAVALADTIGVDGSMPRVRVGFVWGRVLARFGDIFGPPANLAARLTSRADPGTVLVDPDTAEELADEPDLVFTTLAECEIAGLGPMSPVRMAGITTHLPAQPVNVPCQRITPKGPDRGRPPRPFSTPSGSVARG